MLNNKLTNITHSFSFIDREKDIHTLLSGFDISSGQSPPYGHIQSRINQRMT